jgi:type II secretory pathway pseudopilin PulG
MCRFTSSRRGFTLFQLLLVLAILMILFALLLPAIAKVRQSAAAMQGQNNLKQLSLGVINCSDTHQGKMPPIVGTFPVDAPFGGEGTLHFHILPYLEEQQTYTQSLDNDPKGQRYRVTFQDTAARTFKTYLDPNDPSAPVGNVYEGWLGLCNYPGNYLVFQQGGSRYPASITDGTSNTIFFAERYQMCAGQPHAWGYDGLYYWTPMFAYYSTDLFQIMPPMDGCDPERAQALRPEGIQVGMGDGSVRRVSAKVSARTWLFACMPADGNVLGPDW